MDGAKALGAMEIARPSAIGTHAIPLGGSLASSDDYASAKRVRARTKSVTTIAMLSAFQARPLAKAAA
jgi:hypothetical protein